MLFFPRPQRGRGKKGEGVPPHGGGRGGTTGGARGHERGRGTAIRSGTPTPHRTSPTPKGAGAEDGGGGHGRHGDILLKPTHGKEGRPP